MLGRWCGRHCTCVRTKAKVDDATECLNCHKSLKPNDAIYETLSGFILKAPICLKCHHEMDDCCRLGGKPHEVDW